MVSKMRHKYVVCIGDACWIPFNTEELNLKLLAIAHTGSTGHQSTESAVKLITNQFHWKGIRSDNKDFFAECILCPLSSTGAKVPSPLPSRLHGSRPNQVLDFEYLISGNGAGG